MAQPTAIKLAPMVNTKMLLPLNAYFAAVPVLLAQQIQ
jgi:hypothetical protein